MTTKTETLLKLVDEVIENLTMWEAEAEVDGSGLADLYKSDRADYVKIRALVAEGDDYNAFKLWDNLDTTSREYVDFEFIELMESDDG